MPALTSRDTAGAGNREKRGGWLWYSLGKRAAVLTAAGVFAAMSVTGCSGSIDTEAVVATVGDEDITLGVANFYARMMQGQYETYYAGMMGNDCGGDVGPGRRG